MHPEQRTIIAALSCVLVCYGPDSLSYVIKSALYFYVQSGPLLNNSYNNDHSYLLFVLELFCPANILVKNPHAFCRK